MDNNNWFWLMIMTVFLAVIMLTDCGLPKQHDDGPPPPPVAGCNRPNSTPAKATLVLFGAPPCSNCHVSFPEIANIVNALPADVQAKMKVRVYVETGAGWTDPATQSMSNTYVNAVHLCADEVVPETSDSHHRPSYQHYYQYMGTDQEASLPAAVVLDKAGNVVDKFYPGMNFVPETIVNRAVEEANK